MQIRCHSPRRCGESRGASRADRATVPVRVLGFVAERGLACPAVTFEPANQRSSEEHALPLPVHAPSSELAPRGVAPWDLIGRLRCDAVRDVPYVGRSGDASRVARSCEESQVKGSEQSQDQLKFCSPVPGFQPRSCRAPRTYAPSFIQSEMTVSDIGPPSIDEPRGIWCRSIRQRETPG